MVCVPGVSSHPDPWHHVELERTATELRVRLDRCCSADPIGLPTAPPVPGKLGFATYSGLGSTAKSSFNNLQAEFTAAPAAVVPAVATAGLGGGWNATPTPVIPWATGGLGGGIDCSNLVMLPQNNTHSSTGGQPLTLLQTDGGLLMSTNIEV